MAKSNMIEKDIQGRFFDILIDQKDGFDGTVLNVYQKLVFMRFDEVIRNSMPLFVEYISNAEIEKAIILFMKNTPETPFVWQVPNDFRKFVKKAKLFHDRKYLYELLYYDWIEVEIYMREYKLKKLDKFKWKNSYTFSKSARIKKFQYDLINSDYQTKRENYVLIYYDFDENTVLYREINPLIFYLLKSLDNKDTIESKLKILCKENEIDLKEAKTLLKTSFEELYKKRVFF